MKLLNERIEVIAGFSKEDKPPMPIKIRYGEHIIDIQQIIFTELDKRCGNLMFLYRCQSNINGCLRPFELKYEIDTYTWYLYKM